VTPKVSTGSVSPYSYGLRGVLLLRRAESLRGLSGEVPPLVGELQLAPRRGAYHEALTPGRKVDDSLP
jgi:hypothetical protein